MLTVLRRIRSISGPGDAVRVVAGAGIDVYLGQTRFTKTNAVVVDGRELRFKQRGDRDWLPPRSADLEGFREGEYLTNETVFSLTELPRRLVVLTGRPMGSELAQAFRRLGSEVDLVHSRNNLFPKDCRRWARYCAASSNARDCACIANLGRCGRRTAG